MKGLFLSQGILCFGILLFILVRMFKIKDKDSLKVMKSFLVLAISYLVISILSFLWFFEILDYYLNDFLIFFSFVIFVQNMVFFRVVYLFSRNKRMYYFLMLYLFSIPFLLLILNSFSILFLILSYLFSLLIFIDFAIRDDIYRKVGYMGIFYSILSFVMFLFLFFNLENLFLFSFLSGILLFVFIVYFVYDLRKFAVLPFRSNRRGRSYFLRLLGHLIFVITIVNFVFIGTIGVHEFGHFSVSKIYGCEYGKIIYDGDLFHTEVLCSLDSVKIPVLLGGVLFPIFIALCLFFIGGSFLKEIALIMFGFNMVSVSKDLLDLSVSQNFVFVSIFIGVVFLVYGIFILARSKIDIEIYEGGVSEGFSKGGAESPERVWEGVIESEKKHSMILDKHGRVSLVKGDGRGRNY
jgi:hypothetical protein